jgi:hypothetical protein
MSRNHAIIVALLTALLAVLFPAAPAMAVPPSNDDFAAARVVSGVPYSDTAEVTGSTLQTGEPVPSCRELAAPSGTVWYAFTPAQTGIVKISRGIDFESILAVYTGSSLAGLTEIACQYGQSAPLTLAVTAGQTYYLQLGTFFDQVGTLQLDILPPPPPPANDDFAAARTVTGVPYSDTAEVTGSTLQTGEPVPSCRELAAPSGTVWYAFTPSRTTTVKISRGIDFQSILAVYTGSRLATLTETACVFSGTLTLRLMARKTYYLQIGTFFDQTGTLQLDITPTRERPTF